MMTLTQTLGISLVIAFVVMSLLWLFQRKTANAGIVDVGWSGTIPLLVAFATVVFWENQPRGSADVLRSTFAVLLCTLWGARLVLHIHRRSHGKPEDRRYATLRREWAEKAQIKFFWFFQFQAAAAVVFAVPYMLIVRNPSGNVHPLELAGLALWIFAWLGEAVADRQLSRFKSNSSSAGKVCDVGLWRYSRHPNYFFEWLIWCAVAMAAWSAPFGPLALICPALMLFFLFKVTGIPATEEQALKSKGDAYRQYQQTTSAFFPWFKKKE
jgi:steroid 5-alpha reductase family enzyme